MPVWNVEELGAIIRKRRRQLDWDQRYLAERAHVSRQWIVEVEAGKYRAEIGRLLRLLDALDLQMEVAPAPALSERAIKLINLRRSYDDIDRDMDAIVKKPDRRRR